MTTPQTVGLVGTGVVGGRVHRRVTTIRPDAHVVEIDTRVHDPASSPLVEPLDVVILAQPGPHRHDAVRFLRRGVPVVSVGDQVDDVRALIDLDGLAEECGVPLVVGAGMSPGLVGLLARYLARSFEAVDELHIALHGTAGPACARQHHRALDGTATILHDGVEYSSPTGTGRLLSWFPEPVGPYDCYRAEVPAPFVLRRAFPTVERIQARMSANRRDRLTARLPMLTPPHREGGTGAIRVEVRGVDRDGARLTLIGGVAELVGTATAATAVAFADLVLDGGLEPGLAVPGSRSDHNVRLLRAVERLGVRLQEFTGVPSA